MKVFPLSIIYKGWMPFFKEEYVTLTWWFLIVSTFCFFFNLLSTFSVCVTLVMIIATRKFSAGGFCSNDISLKGQTIIITGSNTGIGKETAKDLAKRGAKIILACRDVQKATLVQNEIRQISNSTVVVERLDLSSLDSVRSFADKILNNYSEIHCLVNNAGVMMCPYMKTKDGLEMQMGVNHFGHFLLTYLLLPLLKKGHHARIVNVSSMAHEPGVIPFDDFTYEKGYSRFKSYFNSKLANVLFTRQLAKELKGSNVQVFALHPGAVESDLHRHLPLLKVWARFERFFHKSTFEGAQTSIYCVTEAVQQDPYYYSDCEPCAPCKLAMCDETAEKLWKVSKEITKADSST